MRGPFNANWDKEESLEADRFCRRSSRKQHIFMADFVGYGLCKYF